MGSEELCQPSDLKFGGLCIQKGFDIQEEDINRVVSVTELETQRYYSEVINTVDRFKKEKIRVEFIDGNLAVDCEKYEKGVYECEDYILGVNYDAHMIYVSYDSCLGNTALAHELLHSIEHFYLDVAFDKDESNDHSTPWLFVQSLDIMDNIDILDIVEIRIFVELICTLDKCQSDFEESDICLNIWPELNKEE